MCGCEQCVFECGYMYEQFVCVLVCVGNKRFVCVCVGGGGLALD